MTETIKKGLYPRSEDPGFYALFHKGLVDPKDLPILVAAKQERCPWLVTFNFRHYVPGHSEVKVLKPGDFILWVRDQLAHL